MGASEIIVPTASQAALRQALPDVQEMLDRRASRGEAHRLIMLDLGAALPSIQQLESKRLKVSDATVAIFDLSQSSLPLSSILGFLRRRVRADPFVTHSLAELRRVVHANMIGAADKLIASAALVDNKLLVWSCEPRLYECRIEDLRVLAKLSPDAQRAFEVNDSGSRMHWDEGDVDLDLDTIRFHSDKPFREKVEKDARRRARRYGKAIRVLREQKGLQQDDVGLSDRHVRRLETGKVQPHASTLAKLAAAHGMALQAYLDELARLSGK